MALFPSSYIPTVAATVTRNADSLSFPVGLRPEAMSIYARFIESGTATAVIGSMVLSLDDGAGNSPRMDIEGSGAGGYNGFFSNVTFTSVGSVASGSLGQVVEVLLTLSAAGTMQLSVAVAGGAPTASGTAARALPQAWAGPTKLLLNKYGGGLNGWNAFTHVYVLRNVQTMATMRRYAGVA